MLVKTLKWPFLGAFIAGALHWAVIGLWPELNGLYPTPVLGLIQFGFGITVGYAAVRNGANFAVAALCGALLGLFPLIVYPLSFGLILGEGLHTTLLAGIFGFTMMVFGSLVSSAFSVSVKELAE